MALSYSPRTHLLAPFVICLFLVSSTVSIPDLVLKNVQLRQDKLCQLDNACLNCTVQVERQILVEQSKILQGDLEKVDQQNGVFESAGVDSGKRVCALPEFRDPQQYCCDMWTAFDCRSRIAADKCSFLNFVKYRKHLIQWANDLMLLNICVEFDYGSRQCQQASQSDHAEQQYDASMFRQSSENETEWQS